MAVLTSEEILFQAEFSALNSREPLVQTDSRRAKNIIPVAMLSTRQRHKKESKSHKQAVKGPPCEQLYTNMTMMYFDVKITNGNQGNCLV